MVDNYNIYSYFVNLFLFECWLIMLPEFSQFNQISFQNLLISTTFAKGFSISSISHPHPRLPYSSCNSSTHPLYWSSFYVSYHHTQMLKHSLGQWTRLAARASKGIVSRKPLFFSSWKYSLSRSLCCWNGSGGWWSWVRWILRGWFS